MYYILFTVSLEMISHYTMLLNINYILYTIHYTHPDLFITSSLYLLIPFTYFTQTPQAPKNSKERLKKKKAFLRE